MTLVINNIPPNVTRNDIDNFVRTNTGYSVDSIRIEDSKVSRGALCAWITMRSDTHEGQAASLLNGRYWGSHKLTTGTMANAKKPSPTPPATTQVTLYYVLVGIALILVFAIIVGVPLEIILSIPVIGLSVWLKLN